MDLSVFQRALGDLAKKIITVRTGTVVSDGAELSSTQVVLDNDANGVPVTALGVGKWFPSGTRVACLAYSQRSVLVLGPVVDPYPAAPVQLIYTSNDTYVPPSGLRGVWVTAVAGGGGGGAAHLNGTTECSAGSGGSAGGTAASWIPVASLDASGEAVTVGAGGAGGTSEGNGSNGVDSSFGTHVVATKGLGGGVAPDNPNDQLRAGTDPSSSGTGDVYIPGGAGGGAVRLSTLGIARGGEGGNSTHGSGGTPGTQGSAGSAGAGYGAGGSGASGIYNDAARDGGNGTNGIVIVVEQYA